MYVWMYGCNCDCVGLISKAILKFIMFLNVYMYVCILTKCTLVVVAVFVAVVEVVVVVLSIMLVSST